MKKAKSALRTSVFVALCAALLIFMLGISHDLRGAKPTQPALRIEGKTNIATWDATDYVRVWEKEASGEAFREAWKSARVLRYFSFCFGDATNKHTGNKDLVAATHSVTSSKSGTFYFSHFVVYEDGSTGSPQYVASSIMGGGEAWATKALIANTTSALSGNEVVLMSDNALALFWFNASAFEKRAEMTFPGERGKFYDFCVADVDQDGEDEILVSVHNPGQIWVYDVVSTGGICSFSGPTQLSPAAPASGSLMGQQVRTADVNGDGRLDIMAFSLEYVGSVINRYFNTWIWTTAGYQPYSQAITIPGTIFRFQAADLDSSGDATAELVIGGSSDPKIEIWKWNEDVWLQISIYPLDRYKSAITISPLGGATPSIIVSGSLRGSSMTNDFYLEVFKAPSLAISSQWKFEGAYSQAFTHAND